MLITKTIYIIIAIIINTVYCSLKFNIPSYKDKCFQQELYTKGAIQVRYDLSGHEEHFKGNELQELFKNIKVFVKNENGKIFYETNLKSRKDKFVVHLTEADVYYICARYYKPYRGRELPSSVVMGLKIRHDFYWTDLSKGVHTEDVQHFWSKIRDIKKDMFPTIESAKKEINEEDNTAKTMVSSINTYYKLAVIQLVIIIIFSSLTVYKYRDFFKKKSVI